jgi:hypothetical protein
MLKSILQSAKHQDWRYFLIEDHSWFYLIIDFQQICQSANDKLPIRPKRIIHSQKRLFLISWSLFSFCLIYIFPKEQKFDVEYFLDKILAEIQPDRPIDTYEHSQNYTIFHYDNVRPHAAECFNIYLSANRMMRVPHLAFSSDLAPSDFHVIGKLKVILKGFSFQDEDDLFRGVIEALNDISLQMFEATFEECLIRLDRYINTDRE